MKNTNQNATSLQKPSYTRGPWVAKKDEWCLPRDDWMIGVAGGAKDEIAACDKQNAALISAAPDIFEALQELVGWQTTAPQSVIDEAMAALAKATRAL